LNLDIGGIDMEITKEIFEKYVGRFPEGDDLERCNCPKAGTPLHYMCGWNEEENKPQFMVGIFRHD
jgi:hypothetical protein